MRKAKDTVLGFLRDHRVRENVLVTVQEFDARAFRCCGIRKILQNPTGTQSAAAVLLLLEGRQNAIEARNFARRLAASHQ